MTRLHRTLSIALAPYYRVDRENLLATQTSSYVVPRRGAPMTAPAIQIDAIIGKLQVRDSRRGEAEDT